MGKGTIKRLWHGWGAATVTFAGVVVAALAQVAYQRPEKDSDRVGWWLALSVVGAAMAALAPIVDANLRQRARRSATERIAAAREEQVLAINDALDPLVEKLGELVMTAPADRPNAVRQLIVQALNSAAQVIGPDRTRVNYFEAEAAAQPYRLVCKGSAGRHGQARTVFSQDRPDGEWVIGLLKKDESYFCPNVRTEPPPGWDASRKRSYVTFISVPASVGQEAVGMLTADAPSEGDLHEQDIPLLRVIGTIIAASFRICEDP